MPELLGILGVTGYCAKIKVHMHIKVQPVVLLIAAAFLYFELTYYKTPFPGVYLR